MAEFFESLFAALNNLDFETIINFVKLINWIDWLI